MPRLAAGSAMVKTPLLDLSQERNRRLPTLTVVHHHVEKPASDVVRAG
jgi:hypothetical protein